MGGDGDGGEDGGGVDDNSCGGGNAADAAAVAVGEMLAVKERSVTTAARSMRACVRAF